MKVCLAPVIALLVAGLMPAAAGASPQIANAQPLALSCGTTEFVGMTSNSSTLAKRQCNGSYVYGIGVSVNEAVENLNGFMAVLQAGVSCSADASSIVSGAYGKGVFAQFVCNGWSIAGVGNSPTTAARNSLAIATEMAATGTHCAAPLQGSYYPESWGFRFRYDCGNTQTLKNWSISGLGASIDDANVIAMRLMRYSTAAGQSCNFEKAEINGVILHATLVCNGSYIHGYGSSVTAAANDALAQIGA
ncbi:hypothetical protein [Stenotrophomonas maltophilia]|uniref:hypothetical protein n=1 Tax=Stenotrophomonas maltophilia TaxID=40324 RepID=UPI0036D4A2BE